MLITISKLPQAVVTCFGNGQEINCIHCLPTPTRCPKVLFFFISSIFVLRSVKSCSSFLVHHNFPCKWLLQMPLKQMDVLDAVPFHSSAFSCRGHYDIAQMAPHVSIIVVHFTVCCSVRCRIKSSFLFLQN